VTTLTASERRQPGWGANGDQEVGHQWEKLPLSVPEEFVGLSEVEGSCGA